MMKVVEEGIYLEIPMPKGYLAIDFDEGIQERKNRIHQIYSLWVVVVVVIIVVIIIILLRRGDSEGGFVGSSLQ